MSACEKFVAKPGPAPDGDHQEPIGGRLRGLPNDEDSGQERDCAESRDEDLLGLRCDPARHLPCQDGEEGHCDGIHDWEHDGPLESIAARADDNDSTDEADTDRADAPGADALAKEWDGEQGHEDGRSVQDGGGDREGEEFERDEVERCGEDE